MLPPPETTLSTSPSSVSAGGTVTATANEISRPTSTDWIGLYRQGETNDRNYVYAGTGNDVWLYVWSCTKRPGTPPSAGPANKTCPFTLPAGLEPGTYELRLFSNNGYTGLATSNLFTVTGPGSAPRADAPSLLGSVPAGFELVPPPVGQQPALLGELPLRLAFSRQPGRP